MSDTDKFDKLVRDGQEGRPDWYNDPSYKEGKQRAAHVHAYGRYAAPRLLELNVPTQAIYDLTGWVLFIRDRHMHDPDVMPPSYVCPDDPIHWYGVDGYGARGYLLLTDGDIRLFDTSPDAQWPEQPLHVMGLNEEDELMSYITTLLSKHLPKQPNTPGDEGR